MRTCYRIGVQYVGTNYGGLALNPNSRLPTIMDKLRQSLSKFCSDKLSFSHLKGSSRTDAGVHAIRNVCQFDLIRPETQSEESRSPLNPYEQFANMQQVESLDASSMFIRENLSPIYQPIYDPETVRRGLNYHLESNFSLISVTDCSVISPQFDVRHDAIGRTYMYRIVFPNPHFRRNLRHPPISSQSLFQRDRAWVLPFPISITAINEAAKYFLGEQDFSSIHRRKGVEDVSIRHVSNIAVCKVSTSVPDTSAHLYQPPWEISASCIQSSIERDDEGVYPDEEIRIFIRADSFVQRMVRNIVGILVATGQGKLLPREVGQILQYRDRSKNNIDPAPPQGLYLLNVHYADDH